MLSGTRFVASTIGEPALLMPGQCRTWQKEHMKTECDQLQLMLTRPEPSPYASNARGVRATRRGRASCVYHTASCVPYTYQRRRAACPEAPRCTCTYAVRVPQPSLSTGYRPDVPVRCTWTCTYAVRVPASRHDLCNLCSRPTLDRACVIRVSTGCSCDDLPTRIPGELTPSPSPSPSPFGGVRLLFSQ